jgi:hypothetical protein
MSLLGQIARLDFTEKIRLARRQAEQERKHELNKRRLRI